MDYNHDLLGEPAVPPTYPRTYGGNAAFHNFHNDYSHILDPNLRRRLALSEVCMALITTHITFSLKKRN
jgi:PHS family inorganic phosphate transporter-like MFS transporter